MWCQDWPFQKKSEIWMPCFAMPPCQESNCFRKFWGFVVGILLLYTGIGSRRCGAFFAMWMFQIMGSEPPGAYWCCLILFDCIHVCHMYSFHVCSLSSASKNKIIHLFCSRCFVYLTALLLSKGNSWIVAVWHSAGWDDTPLFRGQCILFLQHEFGNVKRLAVSYDQYVCAL